jgi:uncharacterized membrane protein YkoI
MMMVAGLQLLCATLHEDKLRKKTNTVWRKWIAGVAAILIFIFNVSGQAASGEYLGEDKAKSIALRHAGVDEASLRSLKIEIEDDKGRMIYEVKFHNNHAEYEYEIDAASGTILKYNEIKGGISTSFSNTLDEPLKQTPEALTRSSNAASGFISADQAKIIALNHAGLSESGVTVVKNTRYDKQGKVLYDIEFLTNITAYSYEVNAVTGDIIAYYLDNLHNSAPETSRSTGLSSGNSVQYIGMDAAKRVALNHAETIESAVKKYDSKPDKKDGRRVYEIKFVHAGREYNYQVDAFTGEIVYYESKRD